MKSTKLALILAAGSLLASLGSSALAQAAHTGQERASDHTSHTADEPKQGKSAKTRAEVAAEARKAGKGMHTGQETSPDHSSHVAPEGKQAKSSKTRAEVAADAGKGSKDKHMGKEISPDHKSH